MNSKDSNNKNKFTGSNGEQNNNLNNEIKDESSENTSSETENNESSNTTDCTEEIKANQKVLLDKLEDLNSAIASINSIRENIDSIRVEQLSEIYYTRQVRPLVDSAFFLANASSNMSGTAKNIQDNTFGDRKEIRDSLKLTYKLNEEVEEIVDVLSRRLKIYLKQLDEMDRNCPPFDFKKDS